MAETTPRILMCAPTFFEVSYVINPWMTGHVHDTTSERSQRQWDALRDTVARHADVALEAPAKGQPDMTFAANAGLVCGNRFVPSRFRYAERQGEEAHNRAWFARHGFDVIDLPGDIFFEGAGDALFDRGAPRRLWMGHGHRSDEAAAPALAERLGIDVLPLRLADPRFYHLDTCFCPLAGGKLLYYPAAFTAAALATIRLRVPEVQRIEATDAEAEAFCVNAVNLDSRIVMARGRDATDCAISTNFGYAHLARFDVHTDEVS